MILLMVYCRWQIFYCLSDDTKKLKIGDEYMKIKKIMAYVLLSAVIFALPACSGKENASNAASTKSTESETTQLSEESKESAQTEPVKAGSETEQKNTQGKGTDGKYIMKELSFKRGDFNIYGQIYLPGDGTGTYPTVIIGHEFGANHNSVAKYAEMFSKSGIAAYIFDFYGGGNSIKSDGTMLDMSVFTEVDDMNAILDRIKEQDFADQKNIFLMGASQGGLVAAITASERGTEIGGLVMFYPALSIPDDGRARFKSIDEIPDKVSALGVTISKKYYEDIFNLDVYNTINKYTGDVLIVHGDSDGLVPVSFSERAVEVYSSAKLIKIPKANHGFNGEDAKQAGQEAIKFITDHLKK